MSSAKLAKGSIFIMLGNLLFRFGGYIYHYLMLAMLGAKNYGILSLTIPFQGIFQTLSAGGLPPAIAKYVAEDLALGEEESARQVLNTSLKIMLILGIAIGLLMIFVFAPWLAYSWFQKPEALLPLQMVGFITPFSVIVGAFRGAFQGAYRMELIVATRAVEQLFMIIFAVFLVSMGLFAAGAVIGTAIGFFLSSIAAVILFRKYLSDILPPVSEKNKLSVKEELSLAKKLIKFSIPVVITALSEMGIYDISIFIIGALLASELVGSFNIANTLSRLPLIISVSVGSAVLPAASEALTLKNKSLLSSYINNSLRYVLIIVLPVCAGISVFSLPILQLLFPNAVLGATSLSILVIGMCFYSIFVVSSNIAQGIGRPRIPMYSLLLGTAINAILTWFLVQRFGIEGAALSTTISTFFIMIPAIVVTFKSVDLKFPIKSIGKIVLAVLITSLIMEIIPKTILGLFIAILIATIVYILSLYFLKAFEIEDIEAMNKLAEKTGPLQKYIKKFISVVEKKIS